MKSLLTLIALALLLTACGESAPPAPVTSAEVFLTSSTLEARVDGMHCSGCEASMCVVLQDLPGVAAVKADHKAGTVTVALAEGAAMEPEALTQAIRTAYPEYTIGEVVKHVPGESSEPAPH